MKPNQKRFVLIDDDSNYLNIMKRLAEKKNISLDVFTSLGDLGYIGRLTSYDLAIIDFDLGVVDGEDIATYVDAFMLKVPVIMISGSHRVPKRNQWPKSVKDFVLKEEGFFAPYKSASDVLEMVN